MCARHCSAFNRTGNWYNPHRQHRQDGRLPGLPERAVQERAHHHGQVLRDERDGAEGRRRLCKSTAGWHFMMLVVLVRVMGDQLDVQHPATAGWRWSMVITQQICELRPRSVNAACADERCRGCQLDIQYPATGSWPAMQPGELPWWQVIWLHFF